MKRICEYCEGTGKLGFQREDCCFCNGTGYIGKDILKIFLDGEYNNNNLISALDKNNFELIKNYSQKKKCDYYLYLITPKIINIYLIAKIIDDSNKYPNKTIFCYLNNEVNSTNNQLILLDKIGNMVKKNGGKYFKSLEDINSLLNTNNI